MSIVYHQKLRDANLKRHSIPFCIKTAVLFLTIVFNTLLLFAQSPYKVQIPGTAFSASSAGKKVTIEDFAGGRRFRGQAFAKVILSARLQMPPSSAADTRMQRLVIRFSTSASGPSLRTVELAGGGFHIDTHLTGNYSTREVATPASRANAWVWDPPQRVSATTVLRIEVMFPGGFDSQIDPGEFVLNSVEVGFSHKRP
jgi:hypothetical protein